MQQNYSYGELEVIARIWGGKGCVYKRISRRSLWGDKTVLYLHYSGGQINVSMYVSQFIELYTLKKVNFLDYYSKILNK